jgi:hypothetical protein
MRKFKDKPDRNDLIQMDKSIAAGLGLSALVLLIYNFVQ